MIDSRQKRPFQKEWRGGSPMRNLLLKYATEEKQIMNSLSDVAEKVLKKTNKRKLTSVFDLIQKIKENEIEFGPIPEDFDDFDFLNQEEADNNNSQFNISFDTKIFLKKNPFRPEKIFPNYKNDALEEIVFAINKYREDIQKITLKEKEVLPHFGPGLISKFITWKENMTENKRDEIKK